jgi:hypothetical protein
VNPTQKEIAMLGFMIKPTHFMTALAVALGLAVAALIFGISTGAFEHNNRAALKLERDGAATQPK